MMERERSMSRTGDLLIASGGYYINRENDESPFLRRMLGKCGEKGKQTHISKRERREVSQN
jgi:hypothetical protein